MTFGKKGRPLEDKLARQREIYTAVSPLILQIGVCELSMRQAARAASLSIGGLYYYFPTKRALVLHGLSPQALYRLCQDFHAEYNHLTYVDPRRYIAEGINVVVQQVGFCRPAIHAALELGNESFWEVIDTLLTPTVLDFEVHLQRAVPEVSNQVVHQWGRAIRHSICAALLDKNTTSAEFHDELNRLVASYLDPIALDPAPLMSFDAAPQQEISTLNER